MGYSGMVTIYLQSDMLPKHMQLHSSLVSRPSPASVFDRLQYAKTEEEGPVNLTYMTSQILDMKAYCKQSKTGAGEGLGTRLAACSTSYLAVHQ